MELLKAYEPAPITMKRVQEVIDMALDELEYAPSFDATVAAENVYHYLAHTACWNEDLDAFQMLLDNDRGPDDGAEDLTAFERVEILAAQVERLLNRADACAYSKTIDEDALFGIVTKTYPNLLDNRPADMSVEDFKHRWAMVVAAYIVGGRDYAEYEFVNEADEIGATSKAVATAIQSAFFESHDDAYAIYQLNDEEGTEDLRFMNFSYLQGKGIEPKRENYKFVYAGALPKAESQVEILEQLYLTFNIDRPHDFTGHSLSVSDIVALKQAGVVTYHYVDSISFKELHSFQPKE